MHVYKSVCMFVCKYVSMNVYIYLTIYTVFYSFTLVPNIAVKKS